MQQAAGAIEELDPLSGDRLARAGSDVAALRRQLFGIVYAETWSHGSGPAAQAALIGRYYERFAAHAVAAAKQVCHLAAGRMREPGASGGGPAGTWHRQEHQRPRPLVQWRCVGRTSGAR